MYAGASFLGGIVTVREFRVCWISSMCGVLDWVERVYQVGLYSKIISPFSKLRADYSH